MANKYYKHCILHKYEELYIDILSGGRNNEEGIKYVFNFFKKDETKKGESFVPFTLKWWTGKEETI
jgi:hypothetical protein